MKLDRGQKATERALNDVKRRLKRNYQQAIDEVQAKMNDFNKRHLARDRRYREMVRAGKMSQADYDAWLRGQVFQGQQWQHKKQSLTETLYNADRISTEIVNGGRLNVFATNANYIGYQLESGIGEDMGFNLYSSSTVAKLLKDEPKLLPPRAVKRREDVAWYDKIINNCITQGIIQGEGIAKIAKRIAETTGERGEYAAIRNARTAYTGAQNMGRIEGMRQAQAMGIKVQKQWLATLDGKTRDAHAHLDGQVANVDDYFESRLGPIYCPGDPYAVPANVYNCRCRLISVYPDYPSAMQRRDAETGEIVGDITYDEWNVMKSGKR